MRNISKITIEIQIRKAMITIHKEMIKLRLTGVISIIVICFSSSMFYFFFA